MFTHARPIKSFLNWLQHFVKMKMKSRRKVRGKYLLATLGLERWSARFLRSRSSPLIFFGSGYESQPACGLSGEPFCTELLLYSSKPSLFGRSFPFFSRPRSDAERDERRDERRFEYFKSFLHNLIIQQTRVSLYITTDAKFPKDTDVDCTIT